MEKIILFFRDRHTIIMNVLPLDVPFSGIDPLHVRDAQACMLFWNALVLLLFLNFHFPSSDKDMPDAGMAFCVSIVVLPMCALLRLIFRGSNNWLNEEGSPLLAVSMWDGGWLVNMVVFGLSVGFSMARSSCLEADEVAAVMVEWLLSMIFSWIIIEPLYCLLISVLSGPFPALRPPAQDGASSGWMAPASPTSRPAPANQVQVHIEERKVDKAVAEAPAAGVSYAVAPAAAPASTDAEKADTDRTSSGALAGAPGAQRSVRVHRI